MNAVVDYARRRAKRKVVCVESLSEWVKSIGSLVKAWISMLRGSMKNSVQSIFTDPEVLAVLLDLYDRYIVVLANKAPNKFCISLQGIILPMSPETWFERS